MIELFKRGRYWYCRGSLEGVHVYRSLKTTDKERAGAKLYAIQQEILRGGMIRAIGWTDFQLEFTNWIRPHVKQSSRLKYEWVADRFATFLTAQGLTALRGINPSVISAYQSDRMKDKHPKRNIPMGAEGLKSDLRILRRIFSYAVQCGYMAENPVKVPRLNSSTGKTQPFTREEIQKMLGDALLRQRPELRALVMTFLYTGLRISDVTGLRLDSIRWDAGRLELVTKKRDKPLGLPLHPDLAAALKIHIARLSPVQVASGFVFSTKQGNRDVSIDSRLRRIWARTGIVGGHAHRFRDTFAVFLLEAGASLYDVAKLLAITVTICEKSYAPFTKELAERGRRLVESARFQLDAGEQQIPCSAIVSR